MKRNHKAAPTVLNRWKFKDGLLAALLCFPLLPDR